MTKKKTKQKSTPKPKTIPDNKQLLGLRVWLPLSITLAIVCAWALSSQASPEDGKLIVTPEHIRSLQPNLTEAIITHFDIPTLSKLPRLSHSDALEIVTLLSGPDFEWLGEWRNDAEQLAAMNRQLIEGRRPVLIDGFLADEVAQQLYEEMQQLGDMGMISRSDGPQIPFGHTPVNHRLYSRAKSGSDVCASMPGMGAYTHKHHGLGSFSQFGYPENAPTAVMLWEKMNVEMEHSKWSEALNLLLKGSGYMMYGVSPTDRMGKQGPYFREFKEGDYELMHNDCVHSRTLSITGWLSTPGWQEDWGGNNLWCGIPEQEFRGGPLIYSDSERNKPVFNRVGMLLPHLAAYHLVEPVTEKKPAGAHRYSWTFWTTLPEYGKRGFDQHWKTRVQHISHMLDGETITRQT